MAADGGAPISHIARSFPPRTVRYAVRVSGLMHRRKAASASARFVRVPVSAVASNATPRETRKQDATPRSGD